MQPDSALKMRIQGLSDEDLVKMIGEASQYEPEALSYAEDELTRRGGPGAISQAREAAEVKRRQEYGTKPLYLYIPVGRLIILSLLSGGIYEAYWIYKNWRYIAERDGLEIQPFWRGVFGIFFCHSLLKRMHEDKDARAMVEPAFSPNALASGFVVLLILGNLLSRIPGPLAYSIVGAVMPSYLCLVPVQNYVNTVSHKRLPNSRYYGWSAGHIVCLVIGLILWIILLAS
jgi:hypothetical protein